MRLDPLLPLYFRGAVIRRACGTLLGPISLIQYFISILDQSGTEIVVTSPAKFGQFIADETMLWHGILSGISIVPKVTSCLVGALAE